MERSDQRERGCVCTLHSLTQHTACSSVCPDHSFSSQGEKGQKGFSGDKGSRGAAGLPGEMVREERRWLLEWR